MSHVADNDKYFSKSAKRYDFATRIIAPQRIKLFKAANPKTGDKILDVATGTGAVALTFAQNGFDVTGIDLSEDMLGVARSKKAGLPVEFIKGDASELPFQDKSFDVATVSFALHDMPYVVRVKALKEIRRVLKDNGRFVIMDYAHPANLIWRKISYAIINSYEELYFRDFMKRDLEEQLQSAGLACINKESAILGAAVLMTCTKTA